MRRAGAELGGRCAHRRRPRRQRAAGARPERPTPPSKRHVRTAAQALAPLAREHELVITHGNGPQVGLLALESAADAALARPYPFDVLGAQTQGMIGYWLIQALHNAGVRQSPEHRHPDRGRPRRPGLRRRRPSSSEQLPARPGAGDRG